MVLLYHRVADPPFDPQLLSVTPRHFAEHMDVLRRHTHVVRLCDLAQGVADNTTRGLSIAVTFDDGYTDNLEQARRLLEAAEVPATVFVITAYLDGQREFWWDELERIVFETERLPATLSLCSVHEKCEWDLAGATIFGPMERVRHRGWSVVERDDPTPRHALYRTLFEQLRPLPHGERRKVLDSLNDWAGAPCLVRRTHRTLSAGQVAELASSGIMEVGAHTVTHPVLATLSVEDQRAEIAGSKRCLEAVIGRSVTEFSYPFGTRHDYTAETVDLVRQAGFRVACSNHRGTVGPEADRLRLPRMLVRDWNGETFLRHIEEAWSIA